MIDKNVSPPTTEKTVETQKQHPEYGLAKLAALAAAEAVAMAMLKMQQHFGQQHQRPKVPVIDARKVRENAPRYDDGTPDLDRTRPEYE